MDDLDGVGDDETAIKYYGYKIRYQSLVSVPIQLVRNDILVGQATGSILDNEGDYHLITNWHALSGRDFFTNKPMHPQGCIPETVRVRFHVQGASGHDAPPAHFLWVDFPLYTERSATWKEHAGGRPFDVATLQMRDVPQRAAMLAINRGQSGRSPSLRVGRDVFVVGYPAGIETKLDLPIWKRGSLASEPLTTDDRAFEFLIDCPTRKGLSGSPVYSHEPRRIYQTGDGALKQEGGHFDVIGIYSGRVATSDPFDAAIGRVIPIGAAETCALGKTFGADLE